MIASSVTKQLFLYNLLQVDVVDQESKVHKVRGACFLLHYFLALQWFRAVSCIYKNSLELKSRVK